MSFHRLYAHEQNLADHRFAFCVSRDERKQSELLADPEIAHGVRRRPERPTHDVGPLRTMWRHRDGRLRLGRLEFTPVFEDVADLPNVSLRRRPWSLWSPSPYNAFRVRYPVFASNGTLPLPDTSPTLYKTWTP